MSWMDFFRKRRGGTALAKSEKICYSTSGMHSAIDIRRKKYIYVAFARLRRTLMSEVVVQLHFYNMVLVLAAGLIAGVWGLVLFFRERRSASAEVKKDRDQANSPGDA